MSKHTLKSGLASVALTTVAAAVPLAQAVERIEEVIVVGSTTNTVISPQQLQKFQANDLADVFRHVPSVTVGGSLGIAQKIYVRGVEDTLLNITVDGAPQTGTLFHHIGRVSIEPELLKQVFVQAGAGEATSGAGAVGGAIRFRTKDTDDLLGADEQFGAMLKAGYFSNDGEQGSASAYGRLGADWGMLGSYSYIDRGTMQDGDGENMYGTAADQSLSFVKLNGDITDNQQLSLSYEYRDEDGKFGARPNWPALEGDILYPMNGTRKTVVANYHLQGDDWLRLETTLYRTESKVKQDRFDTWGRYGADITTTGMDLRNTSRFGEHSLTYGVDYREDEVNSEYLDDPSVWADWAWDPALGQFREEGTVAGAYLQHHWQITSDLLLSAGVRYDDYDLKQKTYDDSTSSNGTSPNIGFDYHITDEWKLNLGYAEAMRGKEVGDAFTLERRPGRITLDTDLDPETVDNTELGLEYNSGNLALTGSVYRSKIHDVIQDQLGGGPPPQDAVFYENIGDLETDGFELSAAYQWNKVAVFAAYNNNDAKLNGNTVEGYEQIGLANARGDTWNASINYAFNDALEMGWSITYVDDLNNIEVLQRAVEIGWIDSVQTVDKPSYTTSDIYLQWLPLHSDNLRVNFAVINLFDEQYREHSSVADYNHIPDWEGVAGLNEPGRDIRVSVTYTF
jgi:hemoglobin/transferrin/lactoferrin receptor protein